METQYLLFNSELLCNAIAKAHKERILYVKVKDSFELLDVILTPLNAIVVQNDGYAVCIDQNFFKNPNYNRDIAIPVSYDQATSAYYIKFTLPISKALQSNSSMSRPTLQGELRGILKEMGLKSTADINYNTYDLMIENDFKKNEVYVDDQNKKVKGIKKVLEDSLIPALVELVTQYYEESYIKVMGAEDIGDL
jgi:hypothetical protein